MCNLAQFCFVNNKGNIKNMIIVQLCTILFMKHKRKYEEYNNCATVLCSTPSTPSAYSTSPDIDSYEHVQLRSCVNTISSWVSPLLQFLSTSTSASLSSVWKTSFYLGLLCWQSNAHLVLNFKLLHSFLQIHRAVHFSDSLRQNLPWSWLLCGYSLSSLVTPW